jgi:hydrogenase maturation protease
VVLCIAIGNTLRRDDGVGVRVLHLLGDHLPIRRRAVMQLTPELAQEVAGAHAVLFVDACVAAKAVRVKRLESLPSNGTPLAHAMTAAEVVALAARLYGFQGEAYLCEVPAVDFGPGEQLSHVAEAAARAAAFSLQDLIQCMNPR